MLRHSYNGAYYHPLFHRDKPQDLIRITRFPGPDIKSTSSPCLDQPKSEIQDDGSPKPSRMSRSSAKVAGYPSVALIRSRKSHSIFQIKEVVYDSDHDRNWGKKRALKKKQPSKRLTRAKASRLQNPVHVNANNTPKNKTVSCSEESNKRRLDPGIESDNGRHLFQSLVSPESSVFTTKETTFTTPNKAPTNTTTPRREVSHYEVQASSSPQGQGLDGARCLLSMKGHTPSLSRNLGCQNGESPLTRLVREPLLQYSPEIVEVNNVFAPLASESPSVWDFNPLRPYCVPQVGPLFAVGDGSDGRYKPNNEGKNFAPICDIQDSRWERLESQALSFAAPIPLKAVKLTLAPGKSIAISPMGRPPRGPNSLNKPAIGQLSGESVMTFPHPGGAFTNVGRSRVGASVLPSTNGVLCHCACMSKEAKMASSSSSNPLDSSINIPSKVLDFNGCSTKDCDSKSANESNNQGVEHS